MTREDVERVIKIVADEAWGIAYKGDAKPEVCRAIEALSDDPKVCAGLVDQIMAGL